MPATNAPAATSLVRLLLGGVFLSEGAGKFLFAAELGAGRFARIGTPAPEVMAPFVGAETLSLDFASFDRNKDHP